MRNLIPKEKEAELIYFLFFLSLFTAKKLDARYSPAEGSNAVIICAVLGTTLMQTATGQLISCAKPFQASEIRYPISASLQCRRRSVSIIYINAHVMAADFQPERISAPSGRVLYRQIEKTWTKVFPKLHRLTDRGTCKSSCVCTGSYIFHLRCSSRDVTATVSKQHAYVDHSVETTSIETMYRMGVEIS